MIVQIFDIYDSNTARKLVRLGVDHIGIPVVPEDPKGGVTVEQAVEITKNITGNSKSVILTLSNNIDDISEIVKRIKPDILQLQASLEELDIEKMKKINTLSLETKLMRALPVVDESIIEVAKAYEPYVGYLLLDSVGNQFGATGKVHDWNISRKLVESVRVPVILAGGLGPNNVLDAIEEVKPYGVDSKTKTDVADGSSRKDLEKVKEFIRLARST